MIKKLLAVLFLLIIKFNYSQETSASPYSVFGFGENKFRGSANIFQMGGNSVLSDSIQLNINNPASNAGQLLTTIQVGGNAKYLTLRNNSTSEKAQKITFDYIYLTLPLSKKIGATVGLIQEYGSGYRIFEDTRNTNDIYKKFSGTGGLSKAFLSGGYKINNNFSFGAQFDYYFGNYTNSAIVSNTTLVTATSEVNEAVLRGVGFTASAIYNRKIKNYILTSTLLYSTQSNISVETTRNTALVNYDVTTDATRQVSDVVVKTFPKFTSTLPSKLTFGLGIKEQKWGIGADYTVFSAGNQINLFQNLNTTNFTSGSRFTMGGYFTPKIDNYAKYYERITFRGGFRYEDTGLRVNNKVINDFAFSFGLGLPLSGSMLNLGMEVGKKGMTNAGLIQENYFSVNVGLMLLDKWFRKNYID